MGSLMLEELLRQGVEVDLFIALQEGAELPVRAAPGLRVIVRRTPWKWRRWYSRTKLRAFVTGLLDRTISSILLSLRLLWEHRRRRYDAVYQLSQTELFVLGWARWAAPPIVVHPCTHAAGELRWHRIEEEYALASERRIVHRLIRGWLRVRAARQPRELGRADLVVGLSRRFNELLAEDYGIDPAKLRVVRTPVDLDRFTPEPREPAGDILKILFISRISVRKGVPEVVELSHRLDDLAGEIELIVIGGPTQWSDYSRHMEELNPRVARYLGGLPSDELPRLMRSAAMLLVPSAYEPGPIVTGEALGCGLPVVVSDEVGAAEVLSGPHVRRHRAGDADSLEAAARSLLEAVREDRAGIGTAARANAEEAFSPSGVVRELCDVLEEVSSAPGPAAFLPMRRAPVPEQSAAPRG